MICHRRRITLRTSRSRSHVKETRDSERKNHPHRIHRGLKNRSGRGTSQSLLHFQLQHVNMHKRLDEDKAEFEHRQLNETTALPPMPTRTIRT
jgi:hypothetical protein